MAATVQFTQADMEAFAVVSGDRSAIHSDRAFARRTAFGEPIVYGGLESIAMLGVLPTHAQVLVRRMRSLFPGPVLPGAVCETTAHARGGDWEVRLDGRARLLARLLTGDTSDTAGAVLKVGTAEHDWHLGSGMADLARRFGASDVDPRLLAGIAWASDVVGTRIPDFDGVCAAVSLSLGDGGEPARGLVAIHEPDERTDRMLIDTALVDSSGHPCCDGTIECLPFTPTPLPDSLSLECRGRLPELTGTAVVVGGSRGLGAALALELLVRGQLVHAVYARSDAAAADLVRLAGPFAERLRMHRADARDPGAMAELAAAIGGPIDGCALCAAEPALSMGLAPELADHVRRATELAVVPLAALVPLLRPAGWILFCSSAAVDAPPRELPQLAVAKAALEGLARWTTTTRPQATVVVARPPRMRTDLVNSPSSRRDAVAPETVAALLAERVLHDGAQPGLAILELGSAVGVTP